MTSPSTLRRTASAVFGLLAVTDLLVALLVPRDTALLLLGTLLTLQILLLFAASQVGHWYGTTLCCATPTKENCAFRARPSTVWGRP